MSLLLLFQNRAGADQAILLSAVGTAETAGLVSAQGGAVALALASIASAEHHGVAVLSPGQFLQALIRAYPVMLGSPAYREALVAVVTQYGALLGSIGQHDD